MSKRTLLLASVVLVAVCVTAHGQPINQMEAFCRVVWLFGVRCSQINKTILAQIKIMENYKLGKLSPSFIEANHTSLNGQMERLNFTMIPTKTAVGCNVGGSSTSELWFSDFDNSTNYCNLYNVIHASGLTSAPGYTEYTNEWLCLGYGIATCKG